MRTAEILASRILFWGGVLSILLMTIGIVGFAAAGGLKAEYRMTWGAPGSPQAPRERPGGGAAAPLGRPAGSAPEPPAVYTSIGAVARAVARWPAEPLAIVAAGILLLLATPFASVVAVFVVFVVQRDRRYASIAAVIIGALLVSLLVAAGAR